MTDLKQQVYGSPEQQYDDQGQFYSGPTFRAPNFVEEFGTQTTNKHSRMNTAQFGGLGIPNTAPSLHGSDQKPARSAKSSRRSKSKSRSRKSKVSKTSRQSRLTKNTAQSKKSRVSRPHTINNTSRSEYVQFENETNPVSRASKRSANTYNDGSIYTQLTHISNRRGTKRNFKKKKGRRANVKTLNGFNTNINSKINKLSQLGDLVQGLTSLVESQIECKNLEPCQRLHAQKKKNRAVDTIVRSLSNNRTAKGKRRVVTARFGGLSGRPQARSAIRTARGYARS